MSCIYGYPMCTGFGVIEATWEQIEKMPEMKPVIAVASLKDPRPLHQRMCYQEPLGKLRSVPDGKGGQVQVCDGVKLWCSQACRISNSD